MASVIKNTPTNADDTRDLGSIPGSERSPGGENGNPVQYSCLENPMDRGAWGLQSIGSQRIGHDWSDLACTHRQNFLHLSLIIYSYLGGGVVTKSCSTLATPWTVAWQVPLSVAFSRQECWSGLPFPFPGELPNPRIEPRSPALQADSLPTEL